MEKQTFCHIIRVKQNAYVQAWLQEFKATTQETLAPFGCNGLQSKYQPNGDWLQGLDSNQRPLGYEPNELPLLYPVWLHD